jgi:hypothetical protein
MTDYSLLNGTARVERIDMRSRRYNFLYPSPTTPEIPDPGDRLAEIFSRFASTHQTAFDGERGQSAITVEGKSMERQVERALTQVLGRAPGRSPESFLSALNDTFPIVQYGNVARTPSRNIAPTYTTDGAYKNGDDVLPAHTNGGIAYQMSTRQATTHRQVRLLAGDALRILPTIQAFHPGADPEEIAALKALIDSQLRYLVDEFGRIDGPRAPRITALFMALRGQEQTDNKPEVMGSVKLLGKRALLDCTTTRVTTVQDEVQTTNYGLVKSYVEQIFTIWQENNSTLFLPCDNYSARLEQVNVLLPVVNEANKAFVAALEAIGFSPHSQISTASNLELLSSQKEDPNSAGEPKQKPEEKLSEEEKAAAKEEAEMYAPPPNLTIRELDEWIDQFTALEAPAILGDAGQFGMDLVAYHADELFTVVYSILLGMKRQHLRGSMLVRALYHERVKWSLEDLFFHLKRLADAADGVPRSVPVITNGSVTTNANNGRIPPRCTTGGA